jgi:multiple antibiotic resistance protein
MIDIALIIQLFVLINPLSSLPFVVAAHSRGINVRRLSINAVLTAYLIAVAIALIGPFLFSVFGITLDSFRIAGGIILLLLAIDTIRPPKETEYGETEGLDSLIAILATPLLTGPATISYITIKAYETRLIPLLIDITLAFMIVGVVFIMFSFAIPKIKVKLVDICSKVLALFLTAMAIEMIAKGILGFLKQG